MLVSNAFNNMVADVLLLAERKFFCFVFFCWKEVSVTDMMTLATFGLDSNLVRLPGPNEVTLDWAVVYIEQSSNISKWLHVPLFHYDSSPGSKAHGANMRPIWGRQDPDGPYVGPMNISGSCYWTGSNFPWKMTECQNHSYFTYLVGRPKFIALHKLCLTKEADPDIPS